MRQPQYIAHKLPVLQRPGARLQGLGSVGEVNGMFGDVGKALKRAGQGVVKVVTAGIYDPSKNRLLVPFTGAQVRNFASGTVGVATVGIVKPDKVLDSKVGKVIGNIAAAGEAAIAMAGATHFLTAAPTVSVAPVSPTSAATPITNAAIWDPTVTPSMTGSPAMFGQGLFPASTVSAPTAEFAAMPTNANAFGIQQVAPLPALLQPSDAAAWSMPSANAALNTAATGLAVANMGAQLWGKAKELQIMSGGTSVQPGNVNPYAMPSMYNPFAGPAGSGGGGSYGEAGGDIVGAAVPWLAVGGLVVIGYLLMKKKSK